jgi:phage tail sheath gpL-like
MSQTLSQAAGNIDFAIYPVTNRVPGVFAELNNSKANSGEPNMRSLIIAQMTAAGTELPHTPKISSGVGDAQGKYGLNSMIAQMVAFYRLSDTFGELWVLPLADDPTAIAASGTITPAGPALAAGNIFLYIAGSPINARLSVPVAAGDTAAIMGANIAAAINAATGGPVVASVVAITGVVTVTAVNKGMAGNGIDMRLNYFGAVNGEVLPPGVTVTFGGAAGGSGTLLTGGAVNPALPAALANLSGDQTFDFIICPYTDAISLNAIGAFLNDTTGRWSWSQELFGGAWAAERGTLSQLAAFGVTRNDQHVQIMGVYDSPTPDYLIATDVAANAAVSIRDNPAVPLQNVPLNFYAPPLASRFNLGERNTLLYDGVSTFFVNDAGVVTMERMCTTYQLNSAGLPDNSYLDTETLYTLQYIIRDLRTFVSSNFPRKILVADGTPIPFGSAQVTAQTILAAVNGRYQTYCTAGLAQNPTQFVQQSRAQNAGNGLVKLLLPIQVADQLRQTAMLIQFTKP